MIAYLDTLTALQAILIVIGIGVCACILAAYIDRRLHLNRVYRARHMLTRSDTTRRMASYKRRSTDRK